MRTKIFGHFLLGFWHPGVFVALVITQVFDVLIVQVETNSSRRCSGGSGSSGGGLSGRNAEAEDRFRVSMFHFQICKPYLFSQGKTRNIFHDSINGLRIELTIFVCGLKDNQSLHQEI